MPGTAEPTGESQLASPPRPPAADPEREQAALRQTIEEQTGHIDRLSSLVDSLMQRQQELRRLLQDAHAQLFERDAELERLRARERELEAQAERERKRLRSLQASRWWRLRLAIVRIVGR
jgi:chromosome segregation ATPase